MGKQMKHTVTPSKLFSWWTLLETFRATNEQMISIIMSLWRQLALTISLKILYVGIQHQNALNYIQAFFFIHCFSCLQCLFQTARIQTWEWYTFSYLMLGEKVNKLITQKVELFLWRVVPPYCNIFLVSAINSRWCDNNALTKVNTDIWEHSNNNNSTIVGL